MFNWSQTFDPDSGATSWYTHCYVDTPLGRYMLEWKGWKDDGPYSGYEDSKTILLNGDYLATAYTLEEAKELSEVNFMTKFEEIKKFLEGNHNEE